MEEKYISDLVVANEIGTSEWLGIVGDAHALAPVWISLYLTVLSGYLIVSYIAGAELKNAQVRLVNSVFIISQIFFSLNALFAFFMSNSNVLLLPFRAWVQNVIIAWLIFDLFIFLIMIAGIFACLRFMKDIREAQ